mgnify:FL=1
MAEAEATTPTVDALGVPRHQYRLRCCSCAHKWDAFVSQFEVLDQPCPACKVVNVKVDRSDIHTGNSTFHTPREWRGSESISIAMPEVRPEDRAEWKRDCPSIDFDDRGRVRYRSDAHQRQVYREMNQVRESMKR